MIGPATIEAMPKKTANPSASPADPATRQAVQAASPPRKRTRRRTVADAPVTSSRGRTPALPPPEADRLFNEGVALFNGVRYWHAHEAWETLWRAANDDERDFYQGLIQLAAGLLHLQRRNSRGAQNKLREGVARLQPYRPVHRGVMLDELVEISKRYLEDLDAGSLPYLIPPVIRSVEVDTFDPSR
jgi:hypothetical protein